MTDSRVRPARVDDLAGLLALYRHLHADDVTPEPARVTAAWAAMMHSGFFRVFVAAQGTELVASCTLAIVPNLTRGARAFGVIENVVTHAEHRRAGLGRAVLSAALEAAWAADCYKVTLATGSKKPETLHFYEVAGFVRGGKTYFEARR